MLCKRKTIYGRNEDRLEQDIECTGKKAVDRDVFPAFSDNGNYGNSFAGFRRRLGQTDREFPFLRGLTIWKKCAKFFV